MPKTSTQLKKEIGVTNGLRKKKVKTTEEVKNTKYDFSLVKSNLENTIRFNTFDSDLSSMGKTIEDAYTGWQTPETMDNTISSVNSMKERVDAYEEYRSLFGKGKDMPDLGELRSAFGSASADIGKLTEHYAGYANADEYKKLKELGGMTSSDIEQKMNDVNSDIKSLEENLKIAKEHESKIKVLKTKQNTWAYRSGSLKSDGGYGSKIKEAEKEYDDFLKSIGYKNTDEIKDAISSKSVAYTTVDGQNYTWQSLYDQKKQQEDHNALYKDISSRDDFKEFKEKGANVANPTYEEAFGGLRIAGWSPFGKDINNELKFAKDNEATMILSGSTLDPGDVYYSQVTNEEYDIYNYYLGQELEGVAEKGTADAYLKSIYGTLKDRYENKQIAGLITYADEHPVIASGVSVFQNLASGVEYLGDATRYLASGMQGELDDNSMAKYSSAIRGTVSNKYDWDIGGWDAFDFVYNTTMSGIDSAVSMATLGGAGGVALGLSAAAQGTNDALNRGLDNTHAFFAGISSGVFEGLFESVSIGNFKSLKDLPVDSFKTFAKNIGKTMLVNASEETFTEIANILYDNIVNGDLSQMETDIRAYVSAGMSEEEAKRKVASEQGLRVAEAGASGALMGLGFGAVGGGMSYHKTSSTGKSIRANERTSDLFDITSNPEIGSAYETYTEYANMGINAENAKNAQIGRLYSEASTEARNTLDSEESTDEQKANATSRLIELSKLGTVNENKKAAKEEFNVGEETKVTKTDEVVSVKDFKVDADKITVSTKDGELSVDDVTLAPKDAELLYVAKEIAKEEGNDVANLFVSQYDGKTDVEAYQTSFNLVAKLSKYDSFKDADIFENKGVLSETQASEIFKAVRISYNQAQKKAQEEAFTKMRKNMHRQGFVDDSIFDYDNKSNKSSGRIKWNSLSYKQRKSVTFVKGLFTGLGSNLVFVGKNKNFNGMYHVEGDTIFVDAYAGMDVVEAMGKDSIIPTTAHELTHQMEKRSQKLFNEVKEIVLDTLEKTMGLSRNEIIAKEIARLDEKHTDKKHDEKDAISEIVARACEDMLSVSEEGIRIFNSLSESEQKKLTDKIKDIISKIKDWLTDLLKTYSSKSEEAKALRSVQEAFDEVSKRWDAMLADIAQQNKELKESGAVKNQEIADGEVLEQAREIDANGNEYWQIETDKDIFNGINTVKGLQSAAYNYILNGNKGDKVIGLIDGENLEFIRVSAKEYVYGDSSKSLSTEEYKQKMRMSTSIIDLIDNAPLTYDAPDHKNHKLFPKGFKNYQGRVGIDDTIFRYIVRVGKAKNGMIFYDINLEVDGKVPHAKRISLIKSSTSTNNISNPTQNVNTKFSDRDSDTYSKIVEMKNEMYRLTDKIRELESSDDFGKVMDILTSAISNGDTETGIEAYNKWLDESGYNKLREKRDALEKEVNQLQKDSQDSYKQKLLDDERKAIEESGLSESDYFRKQAVKEFGYTPYFYDAGYITPNGKMLNFSGDKGKHYGSRGQDHRAIGAIYANIDGSKAMIKFMGEGNIRIMAESPGIDISSVAEPTKEQYATIRKFVREYANREYFNIDLTDAEGHTVGNYEYDGKVSAERVVNDIKYFFENGTTREQSSISQFLYSDRDSSYIKAVESGDMETAQRMVEEDAEKAFSNSKVRGSDGKLRLVYHGTVNDFTVFDRQFANIEGDFGKGYYFTSNEYDVDANYANEEGPDLKNKIAHYADKLEWEDEYSDLSYGEREEIARQKFITSEPNTITAYLNMENPVYITPNEKGTLLDFNDNYDEESDEYGEPEGLLVDFIEALQNNASEYAYNEVDFSFLYEYAYENDGVYASDAVGIIKRRIVDDLSDENGDLAINEVIRLAFEEIGFDGIIDTSVYYKFRNMNGMDSGTTHYIVFDSEQIKSAEPVTYDDKGRVIPLSERFNPKKKDIRYSDRDYVAYDYTAILKESTIDRYLASFAAESSPKYAQAYITYMSPSDFLSLTTSSISSKIKIQAESTKLEKERFEKATQHQPIHLTIDHETGEVVGHEGRHRMVALSEEGIYDVPVLLFDSSNKLSKVTLNDFNLIGQFNELHSAVVSEAIPLNYENRDLVIEKFGTKSKAQKMHENLGLRETFLFSDRNNVSVYDIMGERDRLLKENEQFKAEIENLKERVALERTVTNGKVLDNNKLLTAAGVLRKLANTNMNKVELARSLKEVYSYILTSDELTWDEVFSRCYGVAEQMYAEMKHTVEVNEFYKSILADIKKTKISFNESQKMEARHAFDKNWNRYFFGRITLTNDGIPLESMWQEWASLYPDIFKSDINDGDMVRELYDVLGALQSASETVIEYNEEEIKRYWAQEIYNQYWNVSTIKTTSDKYEAKIHELNSNHRNAMRKIREDYKARMDEQHKADMAHSKEMQTKIREHRDNKLKEQHKADRQKALELYKKIRERKDNEIAMAKEKGRERLSQYKENAERKTRIQSITANALTLNEMLVKNSKDKHIPEILKGPVVNLIQALDFSSKRMIEKGEPTKKDAAFAKALGKVKDMMVKATNAHDELVELYGHGLDEDIEMMVKHVDDLMELIGDNEFVLNKMSLIDLQTLDKMVKTIKSAVSKMNQFHTVHHARGIASLSQESVSYLDSLGKGKIYDGLRGGAKKLLDWGNALPYYVFKRFGSGGMKVYEALQDGWDKFAFNVKKIIDYTNSVYTSKEVKEWSEEVKTFKIKIPTDLESNKQQYQEVQMTIPQIMSMYCLAKREQAKGHLFGGGIRVADFKNKKGEIISQAEGIIFTESDILQIFDSLTDRQKEVADKLQRFMNTVCSDWGNEVSMARFGYKAFGEDNYFPIQSDENNLSVNDATEQNNSLFKLLNMSFTKSVIDKADNRIVISDIFDVFAQHTSDMAKYNALALPVLDSFKWYNYKEKIFTTEDKFITKGVKQSIENAFGKDGKNYFTTFLKDINGSQEVSRDTLGKGFFSNAKIAAVGANLRVMLLQPTSYVRASAVIDNKYLLKALGHKPKINRAETHCGIALWKSMGYYDTNIQRGVETQIKHNESIKDKVTDLSMKGAEWADKVTWGYLWNACELEIRETRKDLKVGSEEFYTEIGKRLREVIYATQVVDSTMTRSQMMRSTDGRDKILTAFASEPTLAYNMLQDAYMGLTLDARRMGNKEAWKKNGKRVARIVSAYTMTNALAALVESAFDALRDDDEEDLIAFMKLYFKNFAFDMSIGSKIPYVKEIYSAIQGFGSSRTDTQWMEYLTKSITTWYKIFNGGKNAPATAIKYSIKAISDLSGVPLYNVYRDTMATLDNFDLFSAEDLNEMFEGFFD